MKNKSVALLCCMFFITFSIAQNSTDKIERSINKADHIINKGKAIIEVFQPYLLKARQLYAEAKQMTRDVKASARSTKTNAGMDAGNPVTTNSGSAAQGYNPGTDPAAGYPSSNGNTDANAAPQPAVAEPAAQYGVYNNYTPQQYLPVNNKASVNIDGSGNWGNQNNGLYGNCLDVLTGTVMSMGEAEDNPNSVDLLFFAPADGQNTYVLMTPSFAKNNSSATYMSQHASDAVTKWKDVTESEVALTRLTIGQFEKIQNNSQITGAVKNAVNYAGWYSSVGTKLEGQVFAVKVEQENRTVYALVAVVKHNGTSGSNGYLKIKVKSQGIDTNSDGMVDPSSYLR